MQEYEVIKTKLIENKKFNLSENIVIEYNDYFYKTPNPFVKKIIYKDTHPREYLNISYEIIKYYFWNICNIAETEILNDNEFWFIIKQNKIEWKVFSKEDLKNNLLKNNLNFIFEANKKLWEEKWYSLDFLWAQIFYKPFNLHNLIIRNNEIYLFDFWFLNKNSNSIFVKYLSFIWYYFQKFILRFYIN